MSVEPSERAMKLVGKSTDAGTRSTKYPSGSGAPTANLLELSTGETASTFSKSTHRSEVSFKWLTLPLAMRGGPEITVSYSLPKFKECRLQIDHGFAKWTIVN